MKKQKIETVGNTIAKKNVIQTNQLPMIKGGGVDDDCDGQVDDF